MSAATHILVVGGTGMLRGPCCTLATRGHSLSVIARGHARLSSLVADAPDRIHALPADYTDSSALAAAIRTAVMARGPIDTAVCWVHATAPAAPRLIAGMIAGERRPARLIHVLGSAGADPSRGDPGDAGLRSLPGLRYRRVVLGFIVDGSRSRWLTDREICDGVLGTVDADAEYAVVGVVTPWSARPR